LLATSFLMLVFVVHATVQRRRDDRRLADYAYGALAPTLVLAILLVLTGELMQDHEKLVVVGLLFCGIALFFNRGRPIVLAAIVLVAFAMIFLADARGGRIITQDRTFFGVLRTRQIEGMTFPTVRTLLHGTTLHGAQIT